MIRWTPELVYEAARTCSKAKDFETRFSGAWKAAHRFGILQSLSADMGWARSQPTFDECLAIAKTYEFRADWKDSADIMHRRAYHRASRQGWLNRIGAITGAPRQKRRVHSRESVLAIAAQSESIGRMAIENSSAYQMGKKMGLLDEMRAVAGVDRKSWTIEEIRAVAADYRSRTEFQTEAKGAYLWARRRGLLDDVCAHMAGRDLWTLEKARSVAAAYRYRAEFGRMDRGCYDWCRNNGHLDEVCAHMSIATCGFKANAPASLYYIRIDADTGPLWKIGISRKVKYRFNRMDVPYTILINRRYPTGRRARDVERWLLKRYAADRYAGPPPYAEQIGGFTELFVRDVLCADVSHGSARDGRASAAG